MWLNFPTQAMYSNEKKKTQNKKVKKKKCTEVLICDHFNMIHFFDKPEHVISAQ